MKKVSTKIKKKLQEKWILPVVNALDYVNELRRLVASFDDADESLNHLNKIENFLYSKNIKNIKNMKQRKIDDFLK